MYQISDLKTGVCIELDGTPYQVLDYQHTKVARQAGMMTTKLKNLLTGSTSEKTFKSGEKVKPADVGYKKCQFLYPEGDSYQFMRNDTYEQFAIPSSVLGDATNYVTEGSDVDVQFYGEQPIGVLLAPNMVFEVVETVPGVKGDTSSGGSKPATLNTGKVVQVPLFIKEGDNVRVDTRTGTYMERVNL